MLTCGVADRAPILLWVEVTWPGRFKPAGLGAGASANLREMLGARRITKDHLIFVVCVWKNPPHLCPCREREVSGE